MDDDGVVVEVEVDGEINMTRLLYVGKGLVTRRKGWSVAEDDPAARILSVTVEEVLTRKRRCSKTTCSYSSLQVRELLLS